MREHRLNYCSPAGNVPRCVMVCVTAMPAFHTQELGLCLSVLLADMPTSRTFPAGIARVNNRNRNACALGFIFHKATKLRKAPVMQPLPLLLAGLSPFSDMREVFQRDTETGAFSSGNDCLRDAVVLVFLEPLLFAAHFAKAAFCCFGADALQDCAPFGVAFTVLLDRRAGVLVSLAISCDVHNPEIDTKHPVRREQSGVVKVADASQVPFATHEHQVNLTLSMFEQSALMLTTNKGDFLAPVQQPNRDFVVGNESENPVIVGLGRMFAESALRFLVDLVAVRDLRNTAHGDLSRNLEFGTKLVVSRFVQVILAKYLLLKSKRGKPIACLVATLKRQAQGALLLWRGLQFEIGYNFHVVKYRKKYCMLSTVAKEPQSFGLPAIPPSPEGRGISRRI